MHPVYMCIHEDCAGRGHGRPRKRYHPCILISHSCPIIIFLLTLFTVVHSLGGGCSILIIIPLDCALSHVPVIWFPFFFTF